MGIYTSVSGCSCKRFVVLIWNMFSCLWVSISLSKSEIYDIDYVLFLAVSNEKIIGFHVTMNEMIIVQEFKSLNHLIAYHQGSLNCELSLTIVEKVFQTWSKQVHYHCIVVTFNSEPMNAWNTSCKILNT
jgi:hypothetical protein